MFDLGFLMIVENDDFKVLFYMAGQARLPYPFDVFFSSVRNSTVTIALM